MVVSGRVEGYTRDEAKEALMKAGAKSASSVSKNTDLLIYGEKAGSKLKKAGELGVPCLPQQYFTQLIKDGLPATLQKLSGEVGSKEITAPSTSTEADSPASGIDSPDVTDSLF